MKKDDGLFGSGNDEEEDLFDLSLDDLEPGDTIVEPHVDEPDEDIIELIDLVEKGDIDLAEVDTGPGTLVDTIQDFAEEEGVELKTDETLDLLDIQLDEPVELGQLDELKEEAGEIDAVEITDSDLFIEKDFIKPVETLQTAEVLFDDIAEESAIKDLVAEETEAVSGAIEIEEEISGPSIEEQEAPKIIPVEDKTIRIYPDKAMSREAVQTITLEEAERQLVPAAEEEKVEETPSVQEYAAPAKEEAPQTPPPAAIPAMISEERIEAIIRKAVEDVVERVAREIMAEIIEKTARETMTEIIDKAARETMTELKEKIARETTEMVEKVARETTTDVAERVIGDAINILKNSIESA